MRPVAELAQNFDHECGESEVAVPNPEAGELFDVVVLGFERRSEAPADGLCRLFGLDEKSAQQLVANAPLTVRSALTRLQAEYFRRALHSIGARVELRGEGALLGPVLQPMAAGATPPANEVDDQVEALHLPAAETSDAPSAAELGFGLSSAGEAPLSAARLSLADGSEPYANADRHAADPRLSLASIPARPSKPVRLGDPNLKQAEALARHAAAGRSAQPKALGHVAPPRPTRPQPTAATVPRPAAPTRPAPNALDGEFWQSIPEALSFPFRGRGLLWLISIAIWAALANLLTALASVAVIAGVSVAFFANSSLIAISADLHRRCMWAVSNGDEALDEGPEFDPARILHVYVKSGAQLIVFALCSQLPLMIWIVQRLAHSGIASANDVLGSGAFWLLALAPACYWPLALTTASLYNRFEAVWYVHVGLRIFRRAPLECLSIVVIGAATCVVPLLVGWLIARSLGIPSTLAAAGIGLPIAASHAWLGALTGQLMRARPDAFE
jgi:hypothetical protein